jgi:hypothetical protein
MGAFILNYLAIIVKVKHMTKKAISTFYVGTGILAIRQLQ